MLAGVLGGVGNVWRNVNGLLTCLQVYSLLLFGMYLFEYTHDFPFFEVIDNGCFFVKIITTGCAWGYDYSVHIYIANFGCMEYSARLAGVGMKWV